MLKFFFIFIFHIANIVLIILYLYPCSILGYYLNDSCFLQPQITRNFIISSNHFYAFIILTTFGLFAYQKSSKENFLIKYLILISIILEFFHIIIPNRGFEIGDLLGNVAGVLLVLAIYKIKNQYV